MKKILSLVLVLIMLTAFAACGRGFEAADADDVAELLPGFRTTWW